MSTHDLGRSRADVGHGDGDRGGDGDPITEALQEHLPALRAFVRLRAGPAVAARESASDLVQSVCRELLTERSRFEFRGDAAFKSWLFTAALRKVIEKNRYYHAQKRDVAREVVRGGQAGGGEDDRSVLDCYGHLATPSRDLEIKEQMAQVERAFAQLDEDHREILTLARLLRLPIEEISERMGRSKDACRQLLRRAQIRLTRILETDRGEGS